MTINNHLKSTYDGKTLASVVDYVNIMLYDQNPADYGAPDSGLKLKQYKAVLQEFEKLVPKHKLVMGFEPGPQWNGGVWEGSDTDKAVIDFLKKEKYGGVFFWAINQPKVGTNALPLAEYAKNN